MVALLIPVELHVVRHELLLGDLLEDQEFGLVLSAVVVVTRGGIGASLAIEEALVTMSAGHR